MGCSHQRVPSLSNVAMRFSGSTKSGLPSLVTFSTNAMIDCLARPSFHDASGLSAAGKTSHVNAGSRTAKKTSNRQTAFTMLHLANSKIVHSDYKIREQQRRHDHRTDSQTEKNIKYERKAFPSSNTCANAEKAQQRDDGKHQRADGQQIVDPGLDFVEGLDHAYEADC